MPRAFFSDSFNDIHELKYGQAEEKLEAGGDEKLIFNFIWPKHGTYLSKITHNYECNSIDVMVIEGLS